jgi:hypothetical protein
MLIPIAALAVAAGTSLLLLGALPGRETTQVPSATLEAPSASASAPAKPSYLPEELRHPWLAEPRPLPEWGGDPDRAILVLNQESATIDAGPNESDPSPDLIRRSRAGIDAEGRLRIENDGPITGCPEPAIGTYDWALSDDGVQMTLSGGVDACAARAAFMEGVWLRSACLNPENRCLGIVPAGTYPSQFLSPRVPLGTEWRAQLGALTYTVPDGWAATDDWPSTYTLMPADLYTALNEPGAAPGQEPAAISVWARPAAIAMDDPCAFRVDPDVPTTPTALADSVAAIPALEVSAPRSVRVGDREAVQVDVHVVPGQTESCPGVDVPFVPVVTEAAEDGWDYGIARTGSGADVSDPRRLIFIDIGDGDTVMVSVEAGTQLALDMLLEEAMPIIRSFRFAE